MDNQTNIPPRDKNSGMPQNQTKPEPQNRTLMGILAYLGILVIIPLLISRHDEFVKFHIKQGLVVFCIEIVVWVVGWSFWPLWMVLNLVNLATFILAIIGIINVVHHQQKPLPIIGHLGDHFPV